MFHKITLLFSLFCVLSVPLKVLKAQTINHPFNTGSHQEILVGPSGYTYYDSGGPGSNYLNNHNNSSTFLTFKPLVNNAKIKATFTQFDLEASFDALYVWDGLNSSAPKIGSNLGAPIDYNFWGAGGWWGTVAPNNVSAGVVLAAENSGALTFGFVSDVVVNPAGWAASIEQIILCEDPEMDEEAPIIANCISNQNVFLNANCDAIAPNLYTGLQIQDNCTPLAQLIIEQSVPPGTNLQLSHGESAVITITVTDLKANSSVCTITLTAMDNTAPVVATNDVTVYLDQNGQGQIEPSDINNGSSDNCGIQSLTLNRTQFDCDDIVYLSQSQWQAVGGYNISAADAYYQTIAIDEDGTPYVAYQDYSTPGNKVTVLMWNGSSWSALGGAGGASIGGAGFTELKFSPSGELHLVMIDNGNVRLVKWNGTAWTPIGNPVGISAGFSLWSTFDFDASGTPYVAYRDFPNGEKTTVLKWNGTSWTALGGPGISQGFAEKQSIAVSPDGTPYVAYRDMANGNKLTVLKWNGAAWSALGGIGISQGGVDFPHIVIDIDGNPIVSYTDQANGERLTVLKWNGTTWTLLGTVGFTPGGALHPKMAFNSTNELHITFRNNNNGGKAALMKWNGSTWSFVGPLSASLSGTLWNNLAFGLEDQPYLTFTDYSVNIRTSVVKLPFGFQTVVLTVTDEAGNSASATAKVTVLRNEDTPWVVCPANMNVSIDQNCNAVTIPSVIPDFICGSPAQFPGFTFTQEPTAGSSQSASIGQNITLTVTADDGNGNTSTCQTTLTVVDDTPPHVITQNLTLTLDENGQANITAEDIDNGSSDNCGIASMSLNRTQFYCDDILPSSQRLWQAVGNYGISASTAFYQTIAADDEGNLYVAYQDYSTPGNKITVQKWNGVSWTALGGAGSVSIGGAGNTEIKISPSGEPHVVLIDGGVNSKARLVKWNGSSWVAIGNPAGISAFNVGWTTFDFDAAGTPYVAYRDFPNGEKTTVLKWNGTDWIALGGPGISQGFAEKQSIALSPDGTPYVAYRDMANANKLTVLKWNGATWSALGGVGISQGGVDFPHVMVGTDGNPIVAYTDQANGERLTVLKWNGTTWASLGTVGFTPGGALHPKMAFNSNNELHVTFRNNNNGGRAALIKWDGNTWSFVGPVSASPGASLWNGMTFGPLDQPYLTFTDYANGTKTSVSKLSDDFQTVLLTVTDDSGNSASRAAKVTLVDSETPTITCPPTHTVNILSTPGYCRITVPSLVNLATAVDNCAFTVTQSPAANSFLSSSSGQEHPVTLTVTDQNGNTATCITQLIAADITPPIVTCPPNTEVVLDANCQFELPNQPVQFPETFFPLGEGLVYTLGGENGTGGYYFDLKNESQEPITVYGFGVRFANVAGAPRTLEMYTSPSFAGIETNPAAWTNIGPYTIQSFAPYVPNGTGPLTQIDLNNPIVLAAGETRGFHFYAASAGLLFNYTFAIQPPVINGDLKLTGGPVSFNLLGNLFNINHSAIPNIQVLTSQNHHFVTAFDNCSFDLIQDPPSGTAISSSHGQQHIITFTATDASGNSATCTYTITAIDNTPPAITCPSNQTLMLENGCEAALPDYTDMADASDNCGIATVVQLPAPGTIQSAPGPVTITLTVTDDNDLSNSCTFTVEVEDGLSDPVCPENIELCTGESPITLDGATPTGGTYSGPGVSNGVFDPDGLEEGIHVITYTLVTPLGCERSCTFTIDLSSEYCCPPGSNTPPTTWYEDADEDGYGNPESSVKACDQPAGYVSNNQDCDDSDENINPAASELCNGVDDDCNNVIDEGCVVMAVKGINQFYIENGNTTVSALDGTLLGSAPLNGTLSRTFTIHSEGVYDLLLNGSPVIDIVGANANLFSISQAPVATTIEPGDSVSFTVTYLGAATYGYREATIEITNNDYFNNPFTFVVGAATSPGRMQLRGNGVAIVNGDITPASNDHSDFGTVNFNSNRTRTFNIHNLGAQNLVLTGSPFVKVTGPNANMFTVTLQPGNPITPNQFKQFQVRFDATAIGVFTATIEIESDDLGANPYTFDIKATVASPNMQIRYNSISGAIIENGDENPSTTKGTDYGVRSLNTTRTHTFYVRNLNGGVLLLNGTPRVQITGPGASMFNVATIPAASISAGSSSIMRIAYTPTANGTHHATVSITNNQPDKNPYTFSIVGSTPGAKPVDETGNEPINGKTELTERSLAVFPNPASDWVYLEVEGLPETSDAWIMDASGKILRTLRVNNGIQFIETTSLVPGEYIIKLAQEGYPVLKWIKQ